MAEVGSKVPGLETDCGSHLDHQMLVDVASSKVVDPELDSGVPTQPGAPSHEPGGSRTADSVAVADKM